jgi:hypothetical protein
MGLSSKLYICVSPVTDLFLSVLGTVKKLHSVAAKGFDVPYICF